jgi:hypothetical protein
VGIGGGGRYSCSVPHAEAPVCMVNVVSVLGNLIHAVAGVAQAKMPPLLRARLLLLLLLLLLKFGGQEVANVHARAVLGHSHCHWWWRIHDIVIILVESPVVHSPVLFHAHLASEIRSTFGVVCAVGAAETVRRAGRRLCLPLRQFKVWRRRRRGLSRWVVTSLRAELSTNLTSKTIKLAAGGSGVY